MAVAAIQKADSLLRYAKHMGVKQQELILALTIGEAYELLDHMVRDGSFVCTSSRQLFEADVQRAKAECDPWAVLQHFELYGFSIIPTAALH